ncbi:exonuclease 1 isoform X2 [Anabrus simplex]|uniref:exonuclease 1 isoform X2 n=1 Tax=Anabrus simplex TaxID=316456 RepID=UPI0035A388E3
MGIQGLIPFLEKASRKINVSQFSGCCVAIDAYCWLHKGAYTCAEKLARGEHSDAYVYYCLKFINMLLSHNIKPILVFDGRHLPAKHATETKRRESRECNRKRAAELLRAGRTDEARNYLRRSIDISHDMALMLMRECRRINVDCIVAPYEADAQLAYLNLKGIAQLVITEDSDLVLFGCKKILFKMDVMGNGLLVEQERLHLAMGVRVERFSFDVFRYMCILSGCDYLPSLPGIGLGKALKFFTRTADTDVSRALTRIPAHLNMPSLKVTPEYRDEFLRADATFRYQLVYDPLSRNMVPLTEHPEKDCFIGEKLSPDVAFQLALGNLDPFTLRKVDDFNPDTPQKFSARRAPHPSIWSEGYTSQLHSKQPTLPSTDTSQQVAFMDVKLFRTKVESVVSDKNERIIETDVTLLYIQSDSEPPSKKVRLDAADSSDKIENYKSTSPEEESDATSPVLVKKTKHNPFLKKSTTSPVKVAASPNSNFSALKKFNSLNFKTSNEIVRSRYFASVEIMPDVPKNKVTGEHNYDCEVSSTLMDISNLVDNVCESSNPEKSISDTVQATEQECSVLNCNDSAVTNAVEQKQNVKDSVINSVQDIGKACSAFKWKSSSVAWKENCSLEEDGSFGVAELFRTPSPLNTSKSKSCRRQGLSKNTPLTGSKDKPSQQSLLSRFGFQKKNKLQHSC